MLKNKFRLGRGTNLFAPKVFQTPLFALRISENNLKYNRYGFVVSKKVDKRATVRNALKRKTRRCIENIFSKTRMGFDMMFIVKKSALSKNQDEICAAVNLTLLNKNFLI